MWGVYPIYQKLFLKNKYLYYINGGDGGIRTLDRALQPYNGLANRNTKGLLTSSFQCMLLISLVILFGERCEISEQREHIAVR